MKNLSLVIIALLTLCQPLYSAKKPPRKTAFSVSTFVAKGYGNTKYEYDQEGWVFENVAGRARSELDFPLDALYGGVTIGLGSTVNGKEKWSINLSLSTNLGDPSSVMKDHDWLNAYGYFDVKWSYTESKTDMTSFQANLEGRLTLAQNHLVGFGLIGGVRYLNVSQDLLGLDGWQMIDYYPRRDTVLSMEGLVGKYRVTYWTPNAGLFYRLSGSAVSSEIHTGFGIAVATDRDDHILRNRLGTASSTGYAFVGGLTFRYLFGKDGERRPFIEFKGDYMKVQVSAKQTLYWYGDDPISDEDDTNSTLPNVPHKISTASGYITANIGVIL